MTTPRPHSSSAPTPPRPSRRLSAIEVARAAGQRFDPTEEQAAVIAADAEPLLVTAGAGAGKTETMAARVVWLVANGLARPSEVLGLTFTRKAARELADRVTTRLRTLADSALLAEVDETGELTRLLRDEEPEVSTYDAYAGSLVSTYGLLLPVEPEAILLDDIDIFRIALQVVEEDDIGWEGEQSVATLAEKVRALSGELSNHMVSVDELEDYCNDLSRRIVSLPRGPRQRSELTTAMHKVVAACDDRRDLGRLVTAYRTRLEEMGARDFSTQMSAAARLAVSVPHVVESERARISVVLLDEYQDTGYAQRILLSTLFGHRNGATISLTAVGDPLQSIYGWRGASASNLLRFPTDFRRSDGTPANHRPLRTSWRNPTTVLDAANGFSTELRMTSDGRELVPSLIARPGADIGTITAGWFATSEEEYQALARAMKQRIEAAHAAGDPFPTCAVLVREKAIMPTIAEAFRAESIPVEIVGIGGLLEEPEVADLVAYLRLIHDPGDGVAALRILTGARLRLGAKDIDGIWRYARRLVRMRSEIPSDPSPNASSVAAPASEPRSTGTITSPEQLREELLADFPDEASVTAAMGDVVSSRLPADLAVSPEGRRRLEALGRDLDYLRAQRAVPLSELVAETERVTGLASEVLARRDPTAHSASATPGREHLDAFASLVAGVERRRTVTGTARGDLADFLDYLDASAKVSGVSLAPGVVESGAECVQILTVHAAKGLEWSTVAIVGLEESKFPSTGGNRSMWMTDPAQIPVGLRGDRAETFDDGTTVPGIPTPDLSRVADKKDCEDLLLKVHKEQLAKEKLQEEMRLFYVAMTRTEEWLWLSGATTRLPGDTERKPSVFLESVVERGTELGLTCVGQLDASDTSGDPPETTGTAGTTVATDATGTSEPPDAPILWPADPLGERRGVVDAGAALVAQARAAVANGSAYPRTEWSDRVDMLLAEENERRRRDLRVALPDVLTASEAVLLRKDPDAFARRLRRPVPFKPNPFARRGTALHRWIEHHYGADTLLDDEDLLSLAGDDDEGVDEDSPDLQRLKEHFLESPWAARTPLRIEMPFTYRSSIGRLLRGRMDAVFRDPDRPEDDDAVVIVDWKTGAILTGADRDAAEVQLIVYREAYLAMDNARRRGQGRPPLDPTKVRAQFYYLRYQRSLDVDPQATLEGVATEVVEQLGLTVGTTAEHTPRDIGDLGS